MTRTPARAVRGTGPALWGLLALLVSGIFSPVHADKITRYQTETLNRLEARWNDRAGAQHYFDLGTATGQAWRNGSFTTDAFRYVTVVAACDSDCSQVELRVQDYLNNDVSLASPGDGTSEVGFNAQPGQTYRVYTRATDCRESYCWLATMVLW